MAIEWFDHGGFSVDQDDDYEEYDDEDFLLKEDQVLKKGLPGNRKKDVKFPDSGGPKKKQKNDAKNRYWRKHRDDVEW